MSRGRCLAKRFMGALAIVVAAERVEASLLFNRFEDILPLAFVASPWPKFTVGCKGSRDIDASERVEDIYASIRDIMRPLPGN
ncbi:MAG: hypothetical protein ABL907_19905 [Hyphomicrobium sp.]